MINRNNDPKFKKTKEAIEAYRDTGLETDPLGMYTGNPTVGADYVSSGHYTGEGKIYINPKNSAFPPTNDTSFPNPGSYPHPDIKPKSKSNPYPKPQTYSNFDYISKYKSTYNPETERPVQDADDL